ncbi:MAG: hypothetical protein WC998_04695 [Candidatus Paceibacterota bacterium]|jgi:hypothetical protein
MKFYINQYQNKGQAFKTALIKAGHVEDLDAPDVALFDRDRYIHNDREPRREVCAYINSTIMVYPHSALPPWWYDGLVALHDYVKCVFVIGEGQKRAMNIIAPQARVETTGWPWCEVKPFNRPDEIRNILFAAIHPAGGKLRPEALEANQSIMRDLIALPQSKYNISVRYVENRMRQGLRRYESINWIRGTADNSTTDIDNADLVIAEGTMMHLAVARGKPVIGINQHLPCRTNNHSDLYTPHNWDKYGSGIAYPINYGDAPLEALFDRAMTEQTQWRKDFVGDEMDPIMFAGKVENVWKETA